MRRVGRGQREFAPARPQCGSEIGKERLRDRAGEHYPAGRRGFASSSSSSSAPAGGQRIAGRELTDLAVLGDDRSACPRPREAPQRLPPRRPRAPAAGPARPRGEWPARRPRSTSPSTAPVASTSPSATRGLAGARRSIARRSAFAPRRARASTRRPRAAARPTMGRRLRSRRRREPRDAHPAERRAHIGLLDQLVGQLARGEQRVGRRDQVAGQQQRRAAFRSGSRSRRAPRRRGRSRSRRRAAASCSSPSSLVSATVLPVFFARPTSAARREPGGQLREHVPLGGAGAARRPRARGKSRGGSGRCLSRNPRRSRAPWRARS